METNPLYSHDHYPAPPPSPGYGVYSHYAGKYQTLWCYFSLYSYKPCLPCSNCMLVPSEKKPRPHRPAHFYIPPVLRLPSLFIVFLISLGLIGAVEYGLQKLPHAQKSTYTNPKVVIQSLLHKRQTASTATASKTPTGTTNPGQYASTPSTSHYVPVATPSITPTTSTHGPTASVTQIASPAPQSYVGTSTPTFTSITVPTTLFTSLASILVATNTAGQLTTMTTYIPTTSTGLATIETVISGKSNLTGPEYQFPLWIVFVGNYLALVIVVVFRQFWTAIYAQTKLIEPFIRLAEGHGVPASAVLSTFYLSSNITPDPLLALSKRLWLVLWTSSVYLVVGFLAPLSSELLFLDTKYTNCPFPQPNNQNNPCWPPRLSIDPILSRIVQGLLTYTAIMTLSLMLMTFRVRTGIYSDPSSIGSIAALVHHPDVTEDFRMLSDDASNRDINRLLGDKLYKLDEYQRQDGIWRYGLVPAVPGTFQHYVRDGPPPVQKRSKSRRWKVLDISFDVLFLLVLLALLGIVVAYYKDGKDDPFNRFFNSATFGPRFILTGVGTLIAINWKRLERGKWKQFMWFSEFVLMFD